MTTHYHLCQSVRGPLTNWNSRDWKKATTYMLKNDGTKFTPFALKQVFLDLLADGKEVIPIGKGCDNFDYKTGCNGHPQVAKET